MTAVRLIVAALAAGLALPAAPASAAACTATAAPPRSVHGFRNATAAGGFACDAPRAWVSVEVCLETLADGAWSPVGCETFEATDAPAVHGETTTCRDGLAVYRSAAYGTASGGETASASSVPVAIYCTPI